MNEVFRTVLIIATLSGTSLISYGASEERKKAETMSAASRLRIGWAVRDVTPKGKVNLAGQFRMRITDRVRDPVTVTALAISGGEAPEKAVIFVSCDTVSNSVYLTDKCREKIRALAGDVPAQCLIINATHTHTAPDCRPGIYRYETLTREDSAGLIRPEAYRDFLVEKIVEAAIESWRNRKEGFVAWGLGEAVIGHNRRAVYLKNFRERPDYQELPGQTIEINARMYGNTNDPWFSHIEGYEDHAVQFLFTFDGDRKLTGAAINLACPSQETEGLQEISADFWHDVRVVLREKYGQGLFVLPQCAAAGDQSPHLLLNRKAQERRMKLQGVDARGLIARRVAAAFEETLAWASKDLRTAIPLRHVSKTVDLPCRTVTEEEYRQNQAWIKELRARADQSAVVRFIDRCQKVIDGYEAQGTGARRVEPTEIHAVRLGEIVFATNPFELFLDYGVRIQARSPAVQTFIVQLAARGREWGGGYLPSKRAEAGGGYSASVYDNSVGSDGGDILVDETLGLVDALWAGGDAKPPGNR